MTQSTPTTPRPIPAVRALFAQCLYCEAMFPRWQPRKRADDAPTSGLRERNAHALSVHADEVGA